MIEASIDAKDLDRLIQKLEGSPEIIKSAKAKAFEEAAPKLKQALDSTIGGRGKVKKWQDKYVGCLGGYAAVRPKAKTLAENDKGKITPYRVGYVTNAINSGHKFPTPRGKNQRYRPRIRSGRQDVAGRRFYEAAQAQVPAIAQAAAEQVAAALTEHLEG